MMEILVLLRNHEQSLDKSTIQQVKGVKQDVWEQQMKGQELRLYRRSKSSIIDLVEWQRTHSSEGTQN